MLGHDSASSGECLPAQRELARLLLPSSLVPTEVWIQPPWDWEETGRDMIHGTGICYGHGRLHAGNHRVSSQLAPLCGVDR